MAQLVRASGCDLEMMWDGDVVGSSPGVVEVENIGFEICCGGGLVCHSHLSFIRWCTVIPCCCSIDSCSQH